jgi:hypothetical protein
MNEVQAERSESNSSLKNIGTGVAVSVAVGSGVSVAVAANVGVRCGAVRVESTVGIEVAVGAEQAVRKRKIPARSFFMALLITQMPGRNCRALTVRDVL